MIDEQKRKSDARQIEGVDESGDEEIDSGERDLRRHVLFLHFLEVQFRKDVQPIGHLGIKFNTSIKTP